MPLFTQVDIFSFTWIFAFQSINVWQSRIDGEVYTTFSAVKLVVSLVRVKINDITIFTNLKLTCADSANMDQIGAVLSAVSANCVSSCFQIPTNSYLETVVNPMDKVLPTAT